MKTLENYKHHASMLVLIIIIIFLRLRIIYTLVQLKYSVYSSNNNSTLLNACYASGTVLNLCKLI